MSLPVELIAKKRDRRAHSDGEIQELIDGFVSGQIADYQMSAWLMAVRLNGLNKRETWSLTNAMLHSGRVLGLPSVRPPRIDKHSTGGVGDKISLCLAPLVACCGVRVPMISGRGLGHTGGTLDKLEAIPGYRTDLTAAAFERVLKRVGASIMGQTSEMAPADRRMYALRDVTGTVESIPLITASILSKKLAEGVDGLVFDVKVGSGAFMNTLADAKRLARSLVDVCKRNDKPAIALLTDMNLPIGKAIGNALETAEAFEILAGGGPDDTRELTLQLGAEMLCLGKAARSQADARRHLEAALADGSALERCARMVRSHGGDPRCVFDTRQLPQAPHRVVVRSTRRGWVARCEPKALAWVALEMGAGRLRAEQAVDPAVGIELCAPYGEFVEREQPLAILHVRRKSDGAKFATRVRAAFQLAAAAPKTRRITLGRVD